MFRCRSCGHYQLVGLKPRPEIDSYLTVDPESYRKAMEPERRGPARDLLRTLGALSAEGPLLDVGCSYGWLLQEARDAGMPAFGIEPSESAAADALRSGLAVRCGQFPAEDWDGRSWGVITFMDVLEHLPDLDGILAAVVARLRPGAFLALQVPASSGLVFLASRFLESMSGGAVDGPLRRMLQMDFPFPHVHYFCEGSLRALLSRFGLTVVHAATFPIASGNFSERVSFRKEIRMTDRVQSLALRLLIAGGRVSSHDDLLRLVARRG